jgi:hypothetical protein
MVFLFIQKPLYLSSFPGSTDAKCGVQSIKPLLQRPDCPDPFHRIVGGCPVNRDCSFVDIGGIVGHHCLNFLFIIILCNNNDR